MSDGKQLPVSSTGAVAVQIQGNPDFGYLDCQLPPNAPLLVEGGAMACMDKGMEVKSRLMGGLFKALVRRVFGGESLFVGEYSHPQGAGWSSHPRCRARSCTGT